MFKYLFLLFLTVAIAACTGTKTNSDTLDNEPQDNALKCDSENPTQDIAWINKFATNYTGRRVQAHITRYELDGEYFFEVNNCVNCADAMTVVYTCDHGKKCETGGIAGLRTCGDFYERAGEGKIIWKNYDGSKTPEKSKF